MLNIGTGEMVLILVVALLLLGPQKLPELARGLGKFMREFRKQTDEVRGMVEREFYQMDNAINEPPKALTAESAAERPTPEGSISRNPGSKSIGGVTTQALPPPPGEKPNA